MVSCRDARTGPPGSRESGEPRSSEAAPPPARTSAAAASAVSCILCGVAGRGGRRRDARPHLRRRQRTYRYRGDAYLISSMRRLRTALPPALLAGPIALGLAACAGAARPAPV